MLVCECPIRSHENLDHILLLGSALVFASVLGVCALLVIAVFVASDVNSTASKARRIVTCRR